MNKDTASQIVGDAMEKNKGKGKGMGNTAQRGKELPVIQDVHGNMTFGYRFPVN